MNPGYNVYIILIHVERPLWTFVYRSSSDHFLICYVYTETHHQSRDSALERERGEVVQCSAVPVEKLAGLLLSLKGTRVEMCGERRQDLLHCYKEVDHPPGALPEHSPGHSFLCKL